MDGSAFLVLPASSFSPPTACGSAEDASAKANGTSSHNEGERRRQEMLEVASLLEGKYRTLLPGDRKLADKATADSRDSAEPPDSADGESEVEEPDDQEEPPNQSLQEKLKLKIKLPRGGLPRKKGTKGQAASPSAPRKSRATSSPLAQEANGTVDDVEQGTRKRKKPTSVDEDDSIFPSPANPTVDSMGKTSCVLLQSAMRSASAPQVRKTQQRNVTAFGTKLPPQLDAVRHFELPWWIIRHRDIPDGGEVGAGADVALGSSSLQEEPVQNE